MSIQLRPCNFDVTGIRWIVDHPTAVATKDLVEIITVSAIV
jgi:hypothetical protein